MTPNDIHRFIFVRAPKLKDVSEIDQTFIKYNLPLSNIYKDLTAAKETGNIQALLIKAQDAVDSDIVFSSIDDIQNELSEENDFLKLLDGIEEIGLKKLKEEILKVDTDSTKFSKIWDSILVHSILSNKYEQVSLLTRIIKLYALIEKTKSSKITSKEQIKNVLYGKVVLPKDIFPIDLPPRIHEEEDNSPNEEENKQSDQDLIQNLVNARLELVNFHQKKLSSRHNKTITFKEFEKAQIGDVLQAQTQKDSREKTSRSPGPLPTENLEKKEKYDALIKAHSYHKIDKQEFEKLKKGTQAIIESLFEKDDTYDLPETINEIDNRIQLISSSLSTPSPFNKEIVSINGHIIDFSEFIDSICINEAKLSYCDLLKQLRNNDPNKPIVNVLGIGDLKVIRQTLLKYETGEIAQVKNVFAGEEYERSHRDLQKTILYEESETEFETEEENELSSNSRFELNKELTEISNESNEKQLGVNISAKYGPVKIGANALFASSSSNNTFSKSATNYAKELTERAVSRVTEKIKEKKSKTTINEIETQNTYKLINTSKDNLVGVYKFLNIFYKNQVFNLGRRLMIEAYIPSPAAFYIYSKKGVSSVNTSTKKPIHPAENDSILGGALTHHKQLSRNNYHLWTSAYNVKDVTPPPLEYTTIQPAFKKDLSSEGDTGTFSEEITIPKGYQAYEISAVPRIGNWGAKGEIIPTFWGWNPATGGQGSTTKTNGLPNIEGKLSVGGMGNAPMYFMVQVKCKLSPREFELWKINTYNAIMDAYTNMHDEYESQLAALEIQTGIQITGSNPANNRKTERQELQKWVTEAMILQRFESWNAMKYASNGAPEIDFSRVEEEGRVVSFLQRAFDWENMTYQFYPYFYGKKSEHHIIREMDDVDPKFTDFLKAGYARVILPANYGFEDAVLHFIKNCAIWEGEDIPTLDDPLFKSIVDEIMDKEYDNKGEPEGEEWTTKLPTNLVILEPNDITLPDFS